MAFTISRNWYLEGLPESEERRINNGEIISHCLSVNSVVYLACSMIDPPVIVGNYWYNNSIMEHQSCKIHIMAKRSRFDLKIIFKQALGSCNWQPLRLPKAIKPLVLPERYDLQLFSSKLGFYRAKWS